MGVKLLYARPRNPQAKGKCEKFNQTVDSFLNEAALMNLSTLEEFNRYYQIWIKECYHSKPHAGLKDNQTPECAYNSSQTPKRFLPPEVIADAFLHEEERRVDKAGCISFQGRKYEVGLSYIAQKIRVIYDPANTETITIKHTPSGVTFTATELKIGEHTGPKPHLPEFAAHVKPQTSRLLLAKEKQAAEHEEAVHRAIKYSGFVDTEASND